jgi:transporter family-2 protein
MNAISYTFCCLALVAAGVSVALQQVLNANLRSQLGSPWWAGLISYIAGTVVMLTLALTSSAPDYQAHFTE